GVSVSQYSLGTLYCDGRGVTQDFQEAEKWFKAALQNGLEKAGSALEAMYATGQVERPAAEPGMVKSPIVVPAAQPVRDDCKTVSAQAAAERVLCLRAVLRRSQIEVMLAAIRKNPLVTAKLSPAALEAEAREINTWLKDEDLWSKTSDREQGWL